MSDGITDAARNDECRHGKHRRECSVCVALAGAREAWQRVDELKAEVARLREAVRVKDDLLRRANTTLREYSLYAPSTWTADDEGLVLTIDAALRAGHDGDAPTPPTGGPS